MRIPPDTFSRSLISGTNDFKKKLPGKCNVNAGSFDAILSEEKMDLFSESTLQQFIRIVHKQLNDHLIRIVLGNCGSRNYPGLWPDMMKDLQKQPIGRQDFQQQKNGTNSMPQNYTNRVIDYASRKYGVDAELIRAVIKAESDFDPNSTSAKGAMGLMQLMPETARDLGVKDPYNPAENIMAGTRYLKMLTDRYNGDTDLALAAYNWGMGNLEKHPDRMPEETKTYVIRVNRYRYQATV